MEKPFTDAQIETGRKLFSGPVTFLMGVAQLEQLPPPFPVEICFAGRSNVGKSSLINALTGQHDLARASNTPGRTRELNYFRAGPSLAMVDLPGYGYAKAEKKLVKAWQKLLREYLLGRPHLRRAFVLIDSRHGIKNTDTEMLDLLDETAVSYQIVLTKIDKIHAREADEVLAATIQAISKRPAAHPRVHVTSSERGDGMPELRAELAALIPG